MTMLLEGRSLRDMRCGLLDRRLIASTAAALGLALCCVAIGGDAAARTTEAARPQPKVRTIATIPGRIDGFAHNRRYLAWLRGCSVVVGLTGRPRTRVVRDTGCGGEGLVLAGDRAYWIETDGSNTALHTLLATASVRDPTRRELAYQRLDIDGPDEVVPPRTDGRSVYFWSQLHEDAPLRLRRFDDQPRAFRRCRGGGPFRCGKPVTGTVGDLQLLSASAGRYAFGLALRAGDCAWEPAWAPDGRRIAYASAPERKMPYYWGRECKGGLWVMNADGTGARRIAAAGRNPDWSPDGTQLAYDVSGRIVVADPTGGDQRMLIEDGTNPAWSPDGTEMLFERHGTIVAGRVDGTAERVVVSGGGQPDWSPNGSQVVFTQLGSASRGLAIVYAGGGGLRSLTTAHDSRPAWSPDGRLIAYSHCWNPHVACPDDATAISVIAPDGTGKRDLPVSSDEGLDLGASWSPGSDDLVLARYDGYFGDAHLVRLDGLRTARQLTSAPPPRTPIEIFARNGRRLAQFEPQGVAVALAVTRAAAAAIVREGPTWRVEIFMPRRGSVLLPQRPAPELAASGTKLVLRSGRSIFLLEARTGSLRRVAVAAATPIGLSIVGNRIAWAESGKVTRIRAVDG